MASRISPAVTATVAPRSTGVGLHDESASSASTKPPVLFGGHRILALAKPSAGGAISEQRRC